jgi:glycosyltransferase involved in cell wall biosynthesis
MISDTIEFSGAEESIVTLAKFLCETTNIKLRLCSTRFIDNYIERLSFEDSYVINKKKPLVADELYSTLLNPMVLAKNLQHCIEVADDFQPDVVHSGIFISALPSIIVARRLKVPVVEHIHDFRILSLTDLPFLEGAVSRLSYSQEFKYYLRRVRFYKGIFSIGFRRFFYSLYNQCDLLIAVSNFVKKALSGYLKPPIEVLYNLVDINNEEKGWKKEREKISIVYSGRLSNAKGFPLFLEVSDFLLKNGLDIEVHITGTGELEPFARRFAEKYRKKARFHGFLPRDELYDLISRSHVTVHPSLWPEPCPLSVIKSVKLGTTAIASNRGGLSELLPPKYLFEPTKDSLRKKILELIKNPNEFPPSLAVDVSPKFITNKLVDIYRLVTQNGG